MKKLGENKTHKRKSQRSFLGLPGAVWMTNDLYIKFLNPLNSSFDNLSSDLSKENSSSVSTQL